MPTPLFNPIGGINRSGDGKKSGRFITKNGNVFFVKDGIRSGKTLPKNLDDPNDRIMDLARENKTMFGKPMKEPLSSFQLESTDARLTDVDAKTGFNRQDFLTPKQAKKLLEANR